MPEALWALDRSSFTGTALKKPSPVYVASVPV